jgi:integrase
MARKVALAGWLHPTSVRMSVRLETLLVAIPSAEPRRTLIARDRLRRMPEAFGTGSLPQKKHSGDASKSNSRLRRNLTPMASTAPQPLPACGRSGELGAVTQDAHDLEWQDVDVSGSRFRIRQGKTAAARRFVAVPVALMDEIAATTPPDDRTPERRVFPGFTPDAAKDAMRKACENAGIAHFHPHDLRHHCASADRRRRARDPGRGAARALAQLAPLWTRIRTF